MDGTLYVCIDDTRTLGNVNIKDPRIAIQVLRRLLKQIAVTFWDNDMGHGWEYEGRNLLKQFIQDCKNANHYPFIAIVTSNTVAADDMVLTLRQAGYVLKDNGLGLQAWHYRGANGHTVN